MADGKTSASVVAVDPEQAARERDKAAREMLEDTPTNKGLQQFLKKGLAHTVPFTFKAVAEEDRMEQVKEVCENVLAEAFKIADMSLNTFNEASEVSAVNRLPVGQKHIMSEPLKKVIGCCIRVNAATRGSFDPAVGKLVELLRNAAKEGRALTVDEVQSLCAKSTLSKSFQIDLKEGSISRKHEDATLDLGGVNKGFIVDYVIETLNGKSIMNVFFDWGGDVRASGFNSTGNLWAVGVIRPPPLDKLTTPTGENASYIRVVQLNNEAIATSGDYENLIEGPGKKMYSSIFDWDTQGLLQPSQGCIAQVSVKCYSCMYADALATVCLLKKNPKSVRTTLDSWRYVRETVTDYTTYTRENELVARMFEVATESSEMRAKRISGSLPARVIVIGGGLAGCSAAIEAANCGAHVILLEKEAKIGGNSAKATSGINAWGTRAQAEQGVIDGGKYFERDTFRSGKGGNCDPGLVKTLSVKSAEGIKFLSNLGVPLTILSQLGGASRKRCHRAPDQQDGTPVPIGFTMMRILEQHMRSRLANQITIMTRVTVKRLLFRKEKRADSVNVTHVTGVTFLDEEGKEMNLTGDAVILATGGFSNDRTTRSLLLEYAPHLASFPTTNGAWASGDGVKMARQLGVALVDMDKVQLHPTGLIDPKDPSNRTKYLGPEALRGSGGILVNKRGERFINELELRSVVSQAIIAQNDVFPNSGGSKFAHCILNEEAVKLFGVNSLGFYWKRLGLFVKVDDVPALATLIGCPEDVLTKTLTHYLEVSSGNRSCPLTGKNVFPCKLGPQGPFYVAYVTPSIHYTMGGCLISPSAEIQTTVDDSEGLGARRPILALFGAGEVTGGVHGKNRLGGNSLLECVVFGRVAGDRAATILQKRMNALSNEAWSTVVLREVREGGIYGTGSRVFRFNLPGALQRTGLALGQFIAIRGEWDGQHLIGYYSPITLPDDLGVIGILARSDKGRLAEWLSSLEPGDAVEMKACGGLVIERRFFERHFYFKNFRIKKLALIAGGTGIAPMLQIIRAAIKKPFIDSIESISLVYAAEDVSELTYRELLTQYQTIYGRDKFTVNLVLNKPPPLWTEGVGFVDAALLRSTVQAPSNELLIAICGPPIMQRVVKQCLASQGYNMQLVRTVDEQDSPSSKM